jgi:hypothetical protein
MDDYTHIRGKRKGVCTSAAGSSSSAGVGAAAAAGAAAAGIAISVMFSRVYIGGKLSSEQNPLNLKFIVRDKARLYTHFQQSNQV